jgi:hypothetical protein
MKVTPQRPFGHLTFREPAKLVDMGTDFKWSTWHLWAQGVVEWAASCNPVQKAYAVAQVPANRLGLHSYAEGLVWGSQVDTVKTS